MLCPNLPKARTRQHLVWDRQNARTRWFLVQAPLLIAIGVMVSVRQKESDGEDVNHPDSFDQLPAEFGVHELSLSWKDKGALEQTLIFLRASQP